MWYDEWRLFFFWFTLSGAILASWVYILLLVINFRKCSVILLQVFLNLKVSESGNCLQSCVQVKSVKDYLEWWCVWEGLTYCWWHHPMAGRLDRVSKHTCVCAWAWGWTSKKGSSMLSVSVPAWVLASLPSVMDCGLEAEDKQTPSLSKLLLGKGSFLFFPQQQKANKRSRSGEAQHVAAFFTVAIPHHLLKSLEVSCWSLCKNLSGVMEIKLTEAADSLHYAWTSLGFSSWMCLCGASSSAKITTIVQVPVVVSAVVVMAPCTNVCLSGLGSSWPHGKRSVSFLICSSAFSFLYNRSGEVLSLSHPDWKPEVSLCFCTCLSRLLNFM